MFTEIYNLAKALGLSEGHLLKISRDISHDGALLSVRHMRREHLQELKGFLENVAKEEAVVV